MTRYLVTIALVVLVAALVVVWFAHREAVALDQRAAAEVERIEAEIARGEPLVLVREGPVRIVERERIVVQKAAPDAKPVLSADVSNGGETSGAPVIDCTEALKRAGGKSTGEEKNSSAVENLLVQCPNPLTGCETHITGWRTERGNVLATGTQTRWWQWPGKERQDSTVDLTPKNTKVTADPRLLVTDSAPRWLAGALVGLGSDGSPRYGAVAARKLGGYRGVDLHAVAVGLVGGGDVVVSAGLAVGW